MRRVQDLIDRFIRHLLLPVIDLYEPPVCHAVPCSIVRQSVSFRILDPTLMRHIDQSA